ncbi:MAG: RIP metalloprotease RseP [Rickettsiales bacterium]
MEHILNISHYLLSFIVILTIIVFVHEFGHYFIARLCGVKVTEFSIGFGKRLFGFKDKSGTDWKISLLPLGGYVKMFGDQDPSSSKVAPVKKSEEHLAFYSKSLPAKAAVVAAGPFANFLFAIIILAGFFYTFGKTHSSNEITIVAPKSRAEVHDIRKGDKIIEIDGYKIVEFKDMEKFIASHPEMPLQFKIQRGEEIISKTIKPEAVDFSISKGEKQKIGRLGVGTTKVSYVKLGLYDSIKKAVNETVQICYITLKAIGQMLDGSRGTEDMGGPIKIAKMAGDTAKLGIYAVLWFMAMLSINLGLINLLPIPILDGGHLMFYVVEAIFGKAVASKVQNVGMRIGFALLVTLMLFVIINDIKQF